MSRSRLACVLVLLASIGVSARARANHEGSALGTFLYVGLPLVDGVIFVGGVAAAIGGEVTRWDAKPSSGWRTQNLVWGALNLTSATGYIVATAVTGLWPFLIWPLFAHTGLGVANLVIGVRIQSAGSSTNARLQLAPLADLAPAHGSFVNGLTVRVVAF